MEASRPCVSTTCRLDGQSSVATCSSFLHSSHQPTTPRSTIMAVTIDHAYYPHIIDLVFGYATLQALLRLRVCRDWRKRAEKQLYQVRLFELPPKPDGPSAISYALDGGVPGEPVIFKMTPECYDNPILPSYLGGTSVIDIDMNELNDGVMAILSGTPPDATYRFLNHTQMWDAAPHDSSVVLFDKNIGPRRVEEHFRLGLSNIQNGSKLVLHVRRGGRNWLVSADYEVFATSNSSLSSCTPTLPTTTVTRHLEPLGSVATGSFHLEC